MEDDWRNRTLWCGGLDAKVTEDLLRELFVQGGPVEEVKIPKTSDGQSKNFAFVTFVHADSLSYSLALLEGTCLFGRRLKLERRPRATIDDKYVDMMNRHYEHVRARKAQRSQCGQNDQYRLPNQYPQPIQYPQRYQNQDPYYSQYQNQYRVQPPQYNQYPQYSPYGQYRQYNQYAALRSYARQEVHHVAPPVHTYVPTPIHTYVPTPIRDLGSSPKLASYSGQRVPEYFTGSLKKEEPLTEHNEYAPRQQSSPSNRTRNDECAAEESYYSKRTHY
ncbi:RNA-binding protein 7 [Ixodes scapularis]|uniref:RNA-binding protein 7 n=1 Tax=Ixodes scapularis TaxID=6945 RepID=UPI001A9FEE49|nr:RNA-binding protein 7 [Ixodes scapularis]XP_040355483.1 RNA-binding protein 7 [Ixodes scapularis]